MKVAFYIFPYVLSKSTGYLTFLFIDELRKSFNLDIDLYIPNSNTKTSHDYIDKQFIDMTKIYKRKVIWGSPNANKYDVLLIVNGYSKKWTLYRSRLDIVYEFIKKSKTVISLKYDNSLEHRIIPNTNLLYGVNTLHCMRFGNTWSLSPACKRFIFPSLNLSIPKPNSLTRKQFYKKYNLNTQYKLITIFIGHTKKWYKSNKLYARSIHYLFNNLKKFRLIFRHNKYQFIFKLHKGQETHHIKSNYPITSIQSIHTYEAIKFSDFAITYGTSMVYQLYLYDLPSLEIGSGMYSPGWSAGYVKYKQNHDAETYINHCFDGYNNGKDLIYGQVISFDQLKNNTQNVILSFINTPFNINEFKYVKNNPIYGDSYYSNINNIAKSLVSQLNIINNPSIINTEIINTDTNTKIINTDTNTKIINTDTNTEIINTETNTEIINTEIINLETNTEIINTEIINLETNTEIINLETNTDTNTEIINTEIINLETN
jgi:hypothetical protein